MTDGARDKPTKEQMIAAQFFTRRDYPRFYREPATRMPESVAEQELLNSDLKLILDWLDTYRTAADDLVSAAERVRIEAETVYFHSVGQTPERFELEAGVWALVRHLDACMAKVPLDLPKADRPRGRLDFVNEMVRESGNKTPVVESLRDAWLKGFGDDSELRGGSDQLLTRIAEVFQDDAHARESAIKAGQGARQTWDAALHCSLRTFVQSDTQQSTGAYICAAAPFLAYLLTMAVGLRVPAANEVLWVVATALVLVSAVAVLVAWRLRVSGGCIVALGGGASLAVFTAAYLLCMQFESRSITLPEPSALSTVAEAALLSLTVMVTAGSIDVGFGGPARVIAWIQILFTLFFVGSVMYSGWHRLVRRSERPPTRPATRDEASE